MKTNLFRGFALAAAFAMLLATGTAFASHNKESDESLTTKILIVNAQPGQVIDAFQGAWGFDPVATMDRNTTGHDLLESTTPAATGEPTELFVPVGKVSAIWVWDEKNGYRFLSNVSPADSDSVRTLDASQAKPIP